MTMNPPTAGDYEQAQPPDRSGAAKIYRGRSLAELLPQIRAELGPQALVLRQREGRTGGIGGFFAQRFIEVEATRAKPQIDLYDEPGWGHPGDVAPETDELPPSGSAPARPPSVTPAGMTAGLRAASPVWPVWSGMHAPEVEPSVARAEHARASVLAAGEPGLTGEDTAPAKPQSFAQRLAAALPLERETGSASFDDPMPRDAEVSTGPLQASGSDRDAPTREQTEAQIAAMEAMLRESAIDPEEPAPREREPELPVAADTTFDSQDAMITAREIALAGREAMVAEREAMAADRERMADARETALSQVRATGADGRETAPGEPAPIEAALPQTAPGEPAPIEAAPQATAPLTSAIVTAAEAAVNTQASAAPSSQPEPGPLEACDREICDELVAAGMGEKLARHLIAGAHAHHRPFAPGGALRDAVRAELARSLQQFPGLPSQGAMVAVIGAGGSGKTRVAAALAAAYRSSGALAVRAVALGGREGLPALAALLAPHGVPVASDAAAGTIEASNRAGELVVLDTPGLSPADPQAIELLDAELIARSPDAVLLAMPATTAIGAARRMLEALSEIEPSALVITHADEIDQIGGAVEIAIRSGTPIAYVHDGLELPGALRLTDPTQIAAALLP